MLDELERIGVDKCDLSTPDFEQHPDLISQEADAKVEEEKVPIIAEPLTSIRPLVRVKSGRNSSDEKQKKIREKTLNQQQVEFELKFLTAQQEARKALKTKKPWKQKLR